ncbi:SIP domain-containing protein [Streptomyces sp. 7N604]|uniref:SIP domain-containing protein n=1 Tax=Streptomyces sp. 7N604 TaxID=3457415 RepID=UPI003FD1F772
MPTAANAAAPQAPTPFRFFELEVVRTERISPSMVRVTFGGEQLKDFSAGGRDQSLSLFLPHPGQDAPLVPIEAGDAWFARWRAMDPGVRGVMRSYTVREQRREPDEMDIEFVLHGAPASGGTASGATSGGAASDATSGGAASGATSGGAASGAPASDTPASGSAAADGPASRWAGRARPGDRVIVLGPAVEDNTAVRFRPPENTDWVLIAADETALPAAAAILEWLPPGTPAKVWIEVPYAADRRELPTRAKAEVTWLVREKTAGTTGTTVAAGKQPAGRALDAVRAAELPPGTPYAWIAGESGTVRALRRHLVGERGFNRRAVTFVGYWRRGASEEDLRQEVISGASTDD